MAKIIAHRGFAKEKMQNTLLAFSHATTTSAVGVEMDIRITADNQFVIFHDKNSQRLCGKRTIIEKTTFDKIQKLELFDRSKRHKIPTLLEFLHCFKESEKIAVIEIKSRLNPSQIEQLINLIESEKYLDKTIFISFNAEVLEMIREKLPDQQIQLLRKRYDEILPYYLSHYRFDLSILHKELDKEIIDELHDYNIKVNCWTVNRKKRYKKLLEWGVDFITTDKNFEKGEKK